MTSTTGARAIKVALGLSLVLMGSVATAVLWYAFQKAEMTRHWTPVEAVIISSQLITDRPSPHSPLSYKPEIHYRYTLVGETYTGRGIERVDGPSNKLDKPTALLKEFPAGKLVTCYVNPEHPQTAILKQGSRAPLYSIWFPLLFVVGGLGMVVSAFRTPRS